ncbi:hypothetical protein HPP92_021183 [Vanilla planifolia]|uniref:Core-2/I-branching beta-1,6-N-acetylglucosaminyltransferase family protein n=1 Tax=Vanilla planifolia TaxID=51239 RepID=A0A835Q4B6_VANPL|nr:hypothetical protein HPP92_021183 [Vanilla planifolia]
MTKKRVAATLAPVPLRRTLWTGIQFVASLSVVAFLVAFLRIQNFSPVPPQLVHLRFRDPVSFSGEPKIAFLFLSRAGLPLDFVWHQFFKNARAGNFSIYVHSKPAFKLDKSTTMSSFFYDRQLEDSVQVDWGEASMIEAERLLLKAALKDPANQRFVLVSDSCIPLYNFDYVYNYLTSSPKSFVDSFLDKKECRYNEKMSPFIPKDKWRKGSQWIILIRRHAEVVVDDDVIFPVFKKHCKRRLAKNLDEEHIIKPADKKQRSCIPDEHYLPTLLSMGELDDQLERRTLTYTLWNSSNNATDKQSWHPVTFQYGNASPKEINKIKNIKHVYYDTDSRTEWCQSNGTFVPCFLFARKFSRGAGMRLLSEGFFGPFEPSLLLPESS